MSTRRYHQLRKSLAIAGTIVALQVTSAQAQSAGATSSEPESRRARKLLRAGLDLYALEDYSGAVELFQRSYRRESHPSTLFAMAQATRLSGDCDAAIAMLKTYISRVKSPKQVWSALQVMSQCGIRSESAATPVPAPAPARKSLSGLPMMRTGAHASALDIEPLETDSDGATGRWIGGALLVGGAIALGGSATAYARALRLERDEHSDAGGDGAARNRRWALGLAIASGASIFGGAAMLWLSQDSGSGAGLNMGGDGDGLTLALEGRF